MKFLQAFTMLSLVGFATFTTPLFSQGLTVFLSEPVLEIATQITEKKNKSALEKSTFGGVYFHEDFSNGLNGLDGQWTTAGVHGALWFSTFPVGATNGYNPTSYLTGVSSLYSNRLPIYFGTSTGIQSLTAANGFAMIDLDRFNATPSGETTEIPVISHLISPSFDLEGNNQVELVFSHKARFCCEDPFGTIGVSFSINNGLSWIELGDITDGAPVNAMFVSDQRLDLSTFIPEGEPLDQCRLRFSLDGEQTHYYWMLDDIAVEARLLHDVEILETWYNNYPEKEAGYMAGEISGEDYFTASQYGFIPGFFNNELNFGAAIRNRGSLAQHDVRLKVTGTNWNGTSSWLSAPITLSSDEIDTLWIRNIILNQSDEFNDGMWGFSYEVIQAEPDGDESNNAGDPHQIEVDLFSDNGYLFSAYSNNNNTDFYNITDDFVIWGTPHTFPETDDLPIQITHIQYQFIYGPIVETQIGTDVFFNVRKGTVMQENPDDPLSLTEVIWDSDNPLLYDSEEIHYQIQPEDLTSNGQWRSFELPEPILVAANTVYQAEIKVIQPYFDVAMVFLRVSDTEKSGASAVYRNAEEQWYHLNRTLALGFTVQPVCPGIIEVDTIACAPFEFKDNVYTASGDYEIQESSAYCNSTIYQLNLTIEGEGNTTSNLEVVACDSYELNGKVYYDSGSYIQTLSNAAGCDSIVEIELTVNNTGYSFLNFQECDVFEILGTEITESGEYFLYTSTEMGCDSVVHAIVKFYPTDIEEIEITACTPQTIEGNIYDESGTFEFNYTNIHGCDSTLIYQLTILPPDDPLCETISTQNTNMDKKWEVFPNPSENYLIVSSDNWNVEKMEISDISGRKLKSLLFDGGTGKEQLDISELPSGIFVIEISSHAGTFRKKFVKL